MGKVSIFTQEQKKILAGLGQIKYIRENFYLTGGTALAEFYLHHRYSDDLDLFSTKKFENQVILSLMSDLGKKHEFEFQSRSIETVYIFNLIYKNGERLKIDFAYYPYPQIENGPDYGDIRIDSLRDIATNKLLAINQRSSIKDFVDLYFLLQDQFTIWDLMYGVEVKFKMKTELLLLAQDFLKVEEFDFLPRMVVPLNLGDLQKFFRRKAKEIASQAVEK